MSPGIGSTGRGWLTVEGNPLVTKRYELANRWFRRLLTRRREESPKRIRIAS